MVLLGDTEVTDVHVTVFAVLPVCPAFEHTGWVTVSQQKKASGYVKGLPLLRHGITTRVLHRSARPPRHRRITRLAGHQRLPRIPRYQMAVGQRTGWAIRDLDGGWGAQGAGRAPSLRPHGDSVPSVSYSSRVWRREAWGGCRCGRVRVRTLFPASRCVRTQWRRRASSLVSLLIRTPILSGALSPQTPPKGPPPDPITWRVRALTDGFRKDSSLHSSGVWGFWRGGVFRKEKKVRPLRNCEKLLLEVIVTLFS